MTAKIKLNAASGGGSFSLQAPSSSSNNRVITLPDITDGTLLTSQSSLDSTKLSPAITSGKLLKVTGLEEKFLFSSSSSSLATVKAVTVTPVKTGSKFVVQFNPSQMNIPSATNEMQVKCTDGTYSSGFREYKNFTSVSIRFPPTMMWYMDGNYTAGSAVTFTIQAARSGGSGTVTLGVDNDNWKNTVLIYELDVS